MKTMTLELTPVEADFLDDRLSRIIRSEPNCRRAIGIHTRLRETMTPGPAVIPLSEALKDPDAGWIAHTVKDGVMEAGREMRSTEDDHGFVRVPGGEGRDIFGGIHDTIEDAIRAELQKGNRVFRKLPGGDPVEVVLDEPKVASDAICRICDGGPGNHGVCLCGAHAYEEIPQPVAGLTVPLGPNRTRDGREARVICNDRKGKYPVVALVAEKDGNEKTGIFDLRGVNKFERSKGDLVGHLPAEPPKPLEYWIAPTHKFLQDAICIEKPADADERGYRLFRQVTPATGKRYPAWVSPDGAIMGAPDIDDLWAMANGYRKATFVEVTAP